jgi:hypothetical protein
VALRKTVTVLFSDIEESTSLGESLDSETSSPPPARASAPPELGGIEFVRQPVVVDGVVAPPPALLAMAEHDVAQRSPHLVADGAAEAAPAARRVKPSR